MTNFDNYLEILPYLEVYENGTIYRKERKWNNNGGTQFQPRKICSSKIDGSGYHCINIRINGKNYHPKVHLLVKIKFDGLPVDKYYQVDHIDGDKNNNSISNLEWVSASENNLRAYKLGLHKMTEEQKADISRRMKDNNPMKNKETKKKVSDKLKGRHISDEHKKCISDKLKGRIMNNEERKKHNTKPVYGYKDDILILQFWGMNEAKRNGYNKDGIRNSIINNKEYKGYKWTYDIY